MNAAARDFWLRALEALEVAKHDLNVSADAAASRARPRAHRAHQARAGVNRRSRSCERCRGARWRPRVVRDLRPRQRSIRRRGRTHATRMAGGAGARERPQADGWRRRSPHSFFHPDCHRRLPARGSTATVLMSGSWAGGWELKLLGHRPPVGNCTRPRRRGVLCVVCRL